LGNAKGWRFGCFLCVYGFHIIEMKPKFRIRKLYDLKFDKPLWRLMADVDYWDYIICNIQGVFGVKEIQ
jgi:hypothetical protein